MFTGGEPTISERFIELVLHAKVNGVRVIVITNGNGEIKVYEQLAALQVNLMEFSILSFRPEIHDRITEFREHGKNDVIVTIDVGQRNRSSSGNCDYSFELLVCWRMYKKVVSNGNTSIYGESV